MLNEIVKPLVAWYREYKRELPWRDKNNAYYTWVSEIMLPADQSGSGQTLFSEVYYRTAGH